MKRKTVGPVRRENEARDTRKEMNSMEKSTRAEEEEALKSKLSSLADSTTPTYSENKTAE